MSQAKADVPDGDVLPGAAAIEPAPPHRRDA